jgi:hypothetical protein
MLLVVNPTLGSGFHLPDADHPIGREVEALSDDQMFAGRAQQGIAGRSLIGAMGEVSLSGLRRWTLAMTRQNARVVE